MPSHFEDGIAGRRLVAGLSQKREKLIARHVELTEREGLDGDAVLRALRVEAPALAWRTSHGECPGRYADHERTFRAFLKFPIFLVERKTQAGRSKGDDRDNK
jgi:hypothetical protein